MSLGSVSAFGWDYSVSVSGNTIVVNFSGLQDDINGCCAGATLDDPTFGGASCSIPCGPQTATLTCNRVGPHVLYVYAADKTTRNLPGGPYEYRSTVVTVTVPPPVTCPAFQFYAKTNRAVTHKFGSEDWPRGQSRDAQVDLVFKPIRVDTGTTIYVKVFDPPDPSMYKPAATPPVPDNADTGQGKIAFSPSDTGSVSAQFSAPETGIVPLYLNTTGFAAGDNYVVKASADPNLESDPNFVCGAGCVQTATVTAWKRVYLEKKQMFRSGLFIARPAFSGQNQILVQVPAGRRWNHVSLRAGDTVRLMHAPRYDGLDFWTDFHSEDAVVADVARVPGVRNQRLLTLAIPLAYGYDRDMSYAEAMDHGISDGVGNLAIGVFERNEAYLNNGFGPAFVEFFDVPQGAKEIPYVPIVRQAHRLANKWFENSPVNLVTFARPGNANVKHVLAGTGIPDPLGGSGISRFNYGETGLELSAPPPPVTQILSPNFSWTWALAIEEAVADRGNDLFRLNASIVNGENLVHELAHSFNVNSIFYGGSDYGHCSRPMAGTANAGRSCMMMSPYDPAFDPSQKGDGIVGFHWSADDDSEYMTIRRALEPLAIPRR